MKTDNVIDGPTIEDKIVGANLRRIRQARKESQTMLGEAMGITFQQIQKYEKGVNRVSASRLVQICRHFAVDMNELFRGIEFKKGKDQRIDPIAKFMANPDAVKMINLWHDLDEEHRTFALSLVRNTMAHIVRKAVEDE